jgi:peptidoglycan/LPS O-acetylase OafA/YrhL
VTTRVDVEELQTTKSEKLLAVVLVVFLLIGGVWTYQKIDDWVRQRVDLPSPTGQEALRRADQARQRLFRAQAGERRTRNQLEFRREAYRTALDADEPAVALRARYRAAERAYAAAQRERTAAQRAVTAAAPAAADASRRHGAAVERVERRRDRLTFGLRFALVAAALVAGYGLLWALRRRRTRWFPLAGAAVAFATILAFVLAVDYLTDYFDPFDLGLLVLSLIGCAVTLLAYLALQRYLLHRLPARRVRKRQCPFCGYPVGENAHCEGCGRDVVGACTICAEPRRVGTRYCGACGGTAAPPKHREPVAA